MAAIILRGDYHCYAESDEKEIFKTHKLLNYFQLASFLKTLLHTKDTPTYPFNITLSMCYGARSIQHEKNHIQELSKIDMDTSFAAKIFMLLVPEIKLRMKAVTGSVQFDPQSGVILVESEEGIAASKIHQKLIRDIKSFNETKVTPLLKEFIQQFGEERWIEYLNNDEYKKNSTPLDQVFNQLCELQEELKNVEAIEKNSNQKSYGKVIFEYNEPKNEVSITLEHQGSKQLLKVIKRDNIEEADISEVLCPLTSSPSY